MYFAILTGIENGRFYSSRTDDTLMKNDDFKFNFQGEGHSCQLLVLCSHYFTKMPCFPVFNSWHTYMYFPILTGG